MNKKLQIFAKANSHKNTYLGSFLHSLTYIGYFHNSGKVIKRSSKTKLTNLLGGKVQKPRGSRHWPRRTVPEGEGHVTASSNKNDSDPEGVQTNLFAPVVETIMNLMIIQLRML